MKNRKHKILTMRSNVKTLSLKFYNEQLPEGIDKLKENIKKIDKNKIQVIAIRHDKDTNDDDIWEPAIEKPHYHVIIRIIGPTPMHVSTLIKMLGVQYRAKDDDAMWCNHGAETIRSYSDMAMYLTHDTEQAQLDGKYQYSLSELISNLTIDEIKLIREGYVRPEKVKVTMTELEELDKIAYGLGYELKNFEKWYGQLPFSIRANAKIKVIRESYERGINDYIEDQKSVGLTRLCFFISGPSNTGKTYAVINALAKQGLNTLVISGQGTGKYDNLNPSVDAIVIDDDTAPNLLNMTDNYICRAYKRGKGTPVWSGRYFFVTSNKTFKEWLEDCGIKTEIYKNNCKVEHEHYKAMKSRFFLAQVNHDTDFDIMNVNVTSDCTRGTEEEKMERYDMLYPIINSVNNSINRYYMDNRNKDAQIMSFEDYRSNRVMEDDRKMLEGNADA